MGAADCYVFSVHDQTMQREKEKQKNIIDLHTRIKQLMNGYFLQMTKTIARSVASSPNAKTNFWLGLNLFVKIFFNKNLVV